MATCTDNPRLGLKGCGATYGGELQHSVARCKWSTHPDGRAHLTGTVNQIDKLWRGETLQHPDDVPKAHLELADGRLRGTIQSPWITSTQRARSDETASPAV